MGNSTLFCFMLSHSLVPNKQLKFNNYKTIQVIKVKFCYSFSPRKRKAQVNFSDYQASVCLLVRPSVCIFFFTFFTSSPEPLDQTSLNSYLGQWKFVKIKNQALSMGDKFKSFKISRHFSKLFSKTIWRVKQTLV